MDINSFRSGKIITQTMKRRAGKQQQRMARSFLKGPTSWPWLIAAAALPGRSLAVALAIRFHQGLQKSVNVKATILRLSGGVMSRSSARRGLHNLERRGLISVERLPGKMLMISVIELDDQLDESNYST